MQDFYLWLVRSNRMQDKLVPRNKRINYIKPQAKTVATVSLTVYVTTLISIKLSILLHLVGKAYAFETTDILCLVQQLQHFKRLF